MDYIDYLRFMLEDAEGSLRRANARYVNALQSTAQRCLDNQALMDDPDSNYSAGIVDVKQESFDWVRSAMDNVTEALIRYKEAKKALDIATELGYQLSTAKLSYDTLVAAGLEAERRHKQ